MVLQGTPVNWIEGQNVTISNGTITKNIGVANGYNAGAKGDQLYQSTDKINFEVEVTDIAAVAFGFTESSGTDNYSNSTINYRVQLSTDGTYNIWTNGSNIDTGTYAIGDIFKFSLQNGVIKFYLNNKYLGVYNSLINFPVYIDGSIYKAGISITGTAKIPLFARYIRDYVQGPNGNHWVEIEAYRNNDNLAIGTPVTHAGQVYAGYPSNVTDGDLYSMFETTNAPLSWVEIDLYAKFEVDTIKVWHYFQDGRTYNGTKTQISEDGVNWITVFDSAISGTYAETPEGHTIKVEPIQETPSENFEQIAQLNLNFSESGEKTYTPKGYDFSQWGLTYVDVYFYGEQAFIPVGYEYNQSSINTLPALNMEAAQAYEMVGYSFTVSSGPEEILLDYDAVQSYDLKGYSFEQKSQDQLFFNFVGAASYIPEGYEVSGATQENILLVVAASQTYTAKGLSFEAGAEMILTDLVDAAALFFQANFEASQQESFFLDFEASQEYAAYFEQSGVMAVGLSVVTDQTYTAVGYENESVISESVDLDFNSTQIFAAHFEASGTLDIFIEDLAAVDAVFSSGLQFQSENVEYILLSFGAVQTFEGFEGFQFAQNSSDSLNLFYFSTSLYELGEIGKYSQRASLYLYLQMDAVKEYEKKWLTFGSAAEENINSFTVVAVNEYTQAHFFEASGLNELSLVDAAWSVYDQNYLAFEMEASEYIASHFTDISIHTINFLSFNQEMYYDFLFWADAYSDYELQRKSFESLSAEIIDLTMSTAGQYINANALNSFSTESIGMIFSGKSTFVAAEIYHFESLIPANFNLSFGASSEYTRVHLFDAGASEVIGLIVQAASEYQHINMFKSEAVESLDLDVFGTFRVTTEPRNYEMEEQAFVDLVFYSWVYFESDIYVPKYKLEITKPNTLWEPLPKDRIMVDANKVPNQGMDYSDTLVGRQRSDLVKKRILSLTHITEPNRISYEAEIEKPNTLYSITENEKGGLS